ncbi:MAG: shikimate kinase [Acidobacteria bacterium]|nr:shikimate kinase [Acidobacteriota bacterium]
MRIFIVGFMAAGKTTIGRELATFLDASFVDLDERVEAAFGLPVAEVFETRGETTFRAEEARQLAQCGRFARLVMATGGGTFCSLPNRRMIGRLGLSVFVDVPWETILSRLPGKRGNRPLFRAPEQALALYSARLPHYHQADMTVRPLPDESPASIARRIAAGLGGAT